MRRSAFTLLEMVLAVAMTGSVAIAALSLTSMQARIGTAARAQEETLALVTETVRLLDDDLVLAAMHPSYGRFQVLDGGALRMMTASRLPGEPTGLHEVIWRFDPAAGTVLRTSTPLSGGRSTARAVGLRWKAFAIRLDHEQLWLHGRCDRSEDLWRVPLWTDGR